MDWFGQIHTLHVNLLPPHREGGGVERSLLMWSYNFDNKGKREKRWRRGRDKCIIWRFCQPNNMGVSCIMVVVVQEGIS